MKRLSKYIFVWAVGGVIYYAIEMVFRGFSHWSMFVLGGICMLFFVLQGKACKWRDPFWLQVLRCTIFITACEFLTGMIVNVWLGWQVWDYSNQPFHLFGQICAPFATIFSALSVIGIVFGGYLLHWVFGEEKPQYHLL